jgi:sulfonate transport system ATP-binding protein
MAGVDVCGLTKEYRLPDRTLAALQGFSASFDDGSFTVIVGRSGCGKTTLLRLLSGLEEKDGGEIRWKQTGRPAKVGIVFQEPRLLPWLTVGENMLFSQTSAAAANKAQLLEQYLQLLRLEPFRDAYPAQLSGGMAQRVSLGRTLCYEPDLILMDEPFGALDYFTRRHLQQELSELFLSQKKTVIFVTHDVSEAAYLGQRVLVLDAGRLVGEVPIHATYPRNPLSAELLSAQQQILDLLGGQTRRKMEVL